MKDMFHRKMITNSESTIKKGKPFDFALRSDKNAIRPKVGVGVRKSTANFRRNTAVAFLNRSAL